MGDTKYYLKYENNQYIITELKRNFIDNQSSIFNSIEDIFVFLFDSTEKLSFLDIFKIFSLNNIEYSKSDLIKYYIFNTSSIYNCDDEVYMKIKINKGSVYEILSILPKENLSKKNIKGVSLTLKMQKQYIPFYLAIFIKEYTIEEYYLTIKNIFKGNKEIPYVDLYNHDKEFYVIKNRDKIVYISTNRDMADHYVNIISTIRKDKSMYFVPNIELIYGFKNLVNYLKLQNLNVQINNIKNIVDFKSEFKSINDIDSSYSNELLDGNSFKFVLRTEEDDFILKDNVGDMYDFILKNKIHSPDIMKLLNMKKVISNREVFKSVYLSNVLEIKDIEKLNELSVLDSDNLIKIYSNLISIILDCKYNPLIALLLDNKTNIYDAKFFLSEEYLNSYIESEERVLVLNKNFISDDYLKTKMMEKNLEILMSEQNNFKSNDFVVNLSCLYSKTDRQRDKIKQLKDIQCIIDVDSSLDSGMASCGIVIRDGKGKILGKISKRLNATTSVEAEIRGAMHAIKYAILEDFKEICVRYDYVGIFEYLIDEATTEIRREYQEFFSDIVDKYDVDIFFKKVKAHSLDEYNDLADYLAGNLNVNETFLNNR